MTFIVSKEWIHSNKTSKGAWNAKQLSCLGVDWPASTGWIKRAVGMEITEDMKKRFEQLAAYKSREKDRALEKRILRLENTVAELKSLLTVSN